jgi:hypothetical protein
MEAVLNVCIGQTVGDILLLASLPIVSLRSSSSSFTKISLHPISKPFNKMSKTQFCPQISTKNSNIKNC